MHDRFWIHRWVKSVLIVFLSNFLLGICFNNGDINNMVARAQVRPVQVTAKDISQAQRVLNNKKLVQNKIFRVNLPNFGSCLFVPVSEINPKTKKTIFSIYLIKDNRIIYTFPVSQQIKPAWSFSGLQGVSFLHLDFETPDEDGLLLIANYTTTVSGKNESFPVTILYHRQAKGFRVFEEISQELTSRRIKSIPEAEKLLRTEFLFNP